MLNRSFAKNETMKRALYCTFSVLVVIIFAPYSLVAATSSIPKTGQTLSYTTGDDGDHQGGVSWPSPRFTDNSNGTVTDILTNLTWLKKADCSGTLNWAGALTAASALKDGDCNLTDGSSAQDWRVPNVRELESLIHSGFYSPALPNRDGTGQATPGDPFNEQQTDDYWTSTSKLETPPDRPVNALTLSLSRGHVLSKSKSGSLLSTLFVRDSGSGSPVAEVFATGQTICYDSAGATQSCNDTGQDGDLQKGAVWPIPRFTDNGNGTISDHLSGLTWLKNGGCFGKSGWNGAINSANNLASGSCGLTDSSSKGEWRLPNRREMMSLLDYNYSSPALSNTTGGGQWNNTDPFTNVQATSGYWSSTTYKGFTGHAWYVGVNAGIIGTDGKTKIAYVWPIRQNSNANLSVTILGDGTGTVTSTPPTISCPGVCSSDYEKNSTVTLTAEPDSTSRFEGWSIAGCAKKRECTITMSSDTNVTATFMENSATISSWMILLTR